MVPGLGGVIENALQSGIASNGFNHHLDGMVIVEGALHRLVVLVHVGGMVLVVVKFQGSLGNVGFQGVIGLGEGGQTVGHG